VETVERVLQGKAVESSDATSVSYAGREVPLVDLAAHLGFARRPSESSRILVLNLPTGWLAAQVDEVHEVAIVDAAMISLAGRTSGGADGPRRSEDGLPPGVQGLFVQEAGETLVLDVGRALGFRFS